MLLLTHAETGQYINKTKLQIQNSSLPSSVSMWPTRVRLQGRIQDFFLGGGALVSCSSSTPINHIVFFWLLQNTSCIRNRRSSQEGGAHPLHPPPRSAPGLRCPNEFPRVSDTLAEKTWEGAVQGLGKILVHVTFLKTKLIFASSVKTQGG